jgi:hypothetical protein
MATIPPTPITVPMAIPMKVFLARIRKVFQFEAHRFSKSFDYPTHFRRSAILVSAVWDEDDACMLAVHNLVHLGDVVVNG